MNNVIIKRRINIELVQGLSKNDTEKTNKIFKKLLASLEIQETQLEKSANTSQFRERLTSFGKSLSRFANAGEGKAD